MFEKNEQHRERRPRVEIVEHDCSFENNNICEILKALGSAINIAVHDEKM